jgi:hypothetical protein
MRTAGRGQEDNMNESQGLRGALAKFTGEWTGRNQLWFEPGKPVHECETAASVVAVARGCCVAIRGAKWTTRVAWWRSGATRRPRGRTGDGGSCSVRAVRMSCIS